MKLILNVYGNDSYNEHPDWAYIDLTPELAQKFIDQMNTAKTCLNTQSQFLRMEMFCNDVLFFNDTNLAAFDPESIAHKEFVVIDESFEPYEPEGYDLNDCPAHGVSLTDFTTSRIYPDSIQFASSLKHAEESGFFTGEIPRSIIEEAAGDLPEQYQETT